MAKNPNRKAKPVKRNDPMNGAMKFFLGGCFAELYLLIARRFYIYGTAEQVIAWDGYLPVFGWIGAAILVIGAILTFLWKADKSVSPDWLSPLPAHSLPLPVFWLTGICPP